MSGSSLVMRKAILRAVILTAITVGILGFKTGDKAPDFSLKNQAGKTIKLSDSRGHPVLLYFYPKDGTPGCTTEGCTLRDSFLKFQKLGAVIYGIST